MRRRAEARELLQEFRRAGVVFGLDRDGTLEVSGAKLTDAGGAAIGRLRDELEALLREELLSLEEVEHLQFVVWARAHRHQFWEGVEGERRVCTTSS